MIKLIIFDWDDVFTLGSTEGYYACYHKTLVRLGIKLSAEEEVKRIKTKWGRTAREEIAELLKEHPELVDKGVEIYESILMGDTFVDELKIIEGSQRLVERLSKKYSLAIASGINPQLLKERIFPKFSIPDIFSKIITVYDLDDPAHAKPHPHMLHEIMKDQQVAPDDTIMVGDAKGDVMMAQSAGIIPVVVLTGHLNKKEAKALDVKYIIDEVIKIEDVLNNL